MGCPAYAPDFFETPYAVPPPVRGVVCHRPSDLLAQYDIVRCEANDILLAVEHGNRIRVTLTIPHFRPYIFTVPAERFAEHVVREYNDFNIADYATGMLIRGMEDDAVRYARAIDIHLYFLAASLWNIDIDLPVR